MTHRGRTHRLRSLIALLALIAGFAGITPWIINRPETLRHALAVANLGSDWRIDVKKFSWRPLASEIVIEGISALHRTKEKRLAAAGARIAYRPLGILRGRLVIERLLIDNARLDLPPSPEDEKGRERKRINIAKLVLLRNIELAEGRINGLSISFGRDFKFGSDETRISLSPSFFGDSKLKLRTDGLVLLRADEQIFSAGALVLSATTNLARWHDSFPYMNGIDGKIHVTDIGASGLSMQELAAEASLLDGGLKLSDCKIVIGGRALAGYLNADAFEKRFDLGIDIAKPIALPYLGRPLETVDTAGALSGKIRLAGTGLIPIETSGSGRIELSHRFDASPDAPVSVASDVSWKRGAVKIEKADVTAGKDRFSLKGAIDIPNRKFSLSAEGANFPLEHVFDKFVNPHMRKIFGPTDFKGSIEGWGRKFTAKVTGTAHGGGWKPISAEGIEAELEATYDTLKLKGAIFSGTRRTGSADLSIRFGPKTGDLPRNKQIELYAEISGHPLEQSLAAVGLAGTGSGSIRIRGPHTSFTGEATAVIEGGSWHGLALERTSTRISLSRRQLVFQDMSIKLPKIKEPRITGALTGDIGEGKLRLHGTPLAGLSVDATYRYADSRWIVSNISWDDPDRPGDHVASSGSIASGGAIDLKLGGRIDLGALAFITPLMRSGKGPIDIDLSIRGQTANPKPFGRIAFNDNTLAPRGAALTLEDLNGALKFDGDRIGFDGVTASVDDGEIKLAGYIDHHNLSPTSADLSLSGKAMRFRNEDGTLKLGFEGLLSLSGAFPAPALKGDLTILDGRYTKDFTLIDAMTGGKPRERKPSKEALAGFDPRLDLRVRNTGDLAIRNNVGDIWLNMNVGIKGTRKRPIVSGSIDTTEGKVHYLGMEFDITKGFIEFRERYESPYLEVHAQKEVGVCNASLILHGPTDNLALDLSATSPAGPLEKRDVVSLIMFGVTEQERAMAARAGGAITTSIVGQAVTGAIGRPIQKFTRLDVFRLEAGEPGKAKISRVYFGKQISDRLSVNFATDIDTENAVQTVIGEYQLTDNVILSGSRSSDSHYKIGGALRFRLR